MQYPAAIQYLFSFINFERLSFHYQRELNPKRMHRLLDWFDHPERNQLNGRMISRREFAEIMTKIRPVIEKRKREIAKDGLITFFEVFTLLAILYFAVKKAHFGIFEVGMGGKLDATNVLESALSVITPISFDHEEHLGQTLSRIAGEKAAIVKKRGFVIIGRQPPEAKRVIQREIARKRAKAFFFGRDFKVANQLISLRGSRFDFEMGKQRLKRLEVRLLGPFQIENAACALAVACVLGDQSFSSSLRSPGGSAAISKPRGLPAKRHCSAVLRPSLQNSLAMTTGYISRDDGVSEPSIRKGLINTFWPGRFEALEFRGRAVILDGAHNDASMRALSHALERLFPLKKYIFILGISREKNLVRTLKPILRTASAMIVTKSDNPRAQEPKIVIEALNALGYQKPTFWAQNFGDAMKLIRNIHLPNSILVVAGSLFLVGEARSYFKCPTFN